VSDSDALATLESGPRAVVWRAGGWSGRIPLRYVGVTAGLTFTALLLSVIALGLGEIEVSAVDVLRTLFGTTNPTFEMVVTEWRLPRVLLALLFGAGLGISGAIFQSLTRNPLGSPDVIGFDYGAYNGAVITILLAGSTAYVVPGALVGGLATAFAVYLLAYRRGVQGFRLIVVGIAVTTMLGSLASYLILKADLYLAQMAAIWGAGSLNGTDWADVRVVLLVYAILMLPLACTARSLLPLEMGDDAALALGIRVERVRAVLIVVGVGLSAVVAAVAGPIAFIALSAPQLVRRLTGSSGVQLAASAAMGATLLSACDLIALHAFPAILPVGLITVVLGGAYLVWLLVAQSRKDVR